MADFNFPYVGRETQQFGLPQNLFGQLGNVVGGFAEGAQNFNQLGYQLAVPQAKKDIFTQFASQAPDYTKIAGSLASMGDYASGVNMLKDQVVQEKAKKASVLGFYENQMNASRIAWQRAIEQLNGMRDTYNTSDTSIGADIVNVQEYANKLADKASQAQRDYFDKAVELDVATGTYTPIEFPKQTWSPTPNKGGSTGVSGITEGKADELIAMVENKAKSLSERQSAWDNANTMISAGVKDSGGAFADDLTQRKLTKLGARPVAGKAKDESVEIGKNVTFETAMKSYIDLPENLKIEALNIAAKIKETPSLLSELGKGGKAVASLIGLSTELSKEAESVAKNLNSIGIGSYAELQGKLAEYNAKPKAKVTDGSSKRTGKVEM